MKINAAAFGASGEEAARQHQADAAGPVPVTFNPRKATSADNEVPAASESRAQQESQAGSEQVDEALIPEPRSLFTKPSGNKSGDSVASDTASPKVEAKPSAKSPIGLKWTWPRPSKSSEKEKISTAIEPNKSRPLLLLAGVFVIGAVVGPWLLQRSAPPQPQAAGPNPAVQAVADTLNGGAFGTAPAPLNASTPTQATSSEATLGSVADPQVKIPAAGEERYTAMLERMKSGEAPASDPLTVIPKMNTSVQPSSSAKVEVAKPVDPYPKVAIPLEIEKSTSQPKVQSDQLQIERGIAPSGKYVVLRIERNPEGLLAALLMPVGGRQAIDSAWVFVGDATSDGMVIENINANSVVMRTVAGRSIQIAIN